jgi:hypothetical protein
MGLARAGEAAPRPDALLDGASARPRMIEAAIMPPAVNWPRVTR